MGIDEYVAENRDRFYAELCAYCRIPSVAAEGTGIDEAAEWVAGRLAQLDAEVETLSVPDGPPVVLAELGPVGAPTTLLIYNHYDVQPADPIEAWQSPPFEPSERDGRLFVRGVADNKGNFLSRVHAVEATLAEHGTLPVRIIWLVEGEEEIGSPSLSEFCAKHGERWSSADGCLWESGGKDEHGRAVLYSGLKGIAAFELRLTGANEDKHSANATLLPNPAWRLAWLLSTLKAPDETITIDGLMGHVAEPTEAEKSAVAAIPFDDAALRETHGVEAFVTGVTGNDALLRHLYQPTCTICGIHSGYAGPGMKTVLPSEAFAKLDFRLVPELTPDLVKELLSDHLARHGFEDVELIDLEGVHPARGQLDSTVVSAAQQAVESVTGVVPVTWPHMAATGPMHVVASRFGIPAVGFGTGYPGANIHAPNENIRLADYFEGVRVAAAFYQTFAVA